MNTISMIIVFINTYPFKVSVSSREVNSVAMASDPEGSISGANGKTNPDPGVRGRPS